MRVGDGDRILQFTEEENDGCGLMVGPKSSIST